jgi:hypothetical protein
MKTNCNVTLYNKYSIGDKACYKKTIIKGANWQGSKVQAFSNTETGKGTLNSADVINIFIPFTSKFEGNTPTETKTYIDPKSWAKLSETDKDKYFTFSNTDFIVKGECAFDWGLTNPITNLTKIDNVATIMSVVINDNGSMAMRHYQLGGK